MSGQRSISQVQAHMERYGSIFVFQCSFGAVVFSTPEWFGAVIFKHSPTHPIPFIFHSTDLISVDGCLVWGLMAGLWGFASHGGGILSGGWLDTVEAPGYPRHPPSI